MSFLTVVARIPGGPIMLRTVAVLLGFVLLTMLAMAIAVIWHRVAG